MPKLNRIPPITKRLHIELQCTLAFTCYDSDKVLKIGDSATQKNLEQKIFGIFQPNKSTEEDTYIHINNMFHVELIL